LNGGTGNRNPGDAFVRVLRCVLILGRKEYIQRYLVWVE
jgi:hypothetical protein